MCLIGKRDWAKVNDLTGEEVKCTFYQGFDEKGKPIEFKSNNDDYEVFEVMKYEGDKAKEFDLKAVFDSFKGRMKYVEIESQ